jgi:hypothetical protein
MQTLCSARTIATLLALLTTALLLSAGCTRMGSKGEGGVGTLLSASAAFVGNGTCKECHPAEFELHRHSRHASTLRSLTSRQSGEWVPPDGAIRRTPYALRAQGDAVVFASSDPPQEVRAIRLAFGSGKTGITYVSPLDGDSLLEMRMSYFPHQQRWCVTPGQEGLQDRSLGFVHHGKSARRCVLCHAVTLPAGSLSPDPRFYGVGCEACHGPGSAHIEAVKAGKTGALSMEKIGRWEATRINGLCAKCHRSLDDIDVNSMSVTMTQRFQPYGLMQSPCFQQSHDTLSCLNCHDPHADASTDRKHYEAACLQCHSPARPAGGTRAQPVVSGNVCPVNPREKCIGCHMRPRKVFVSSDVSTTMADHLIMAERTAASR